MSFIPWWVHYPNVNNEILNLDWLLKISNCNTHKIENFINLNTIKYADPILWNITSQYEANTVVVDGQTGNAYISTKAVPAGVHLNRTEYWTQIYNYADALGDLRRQIAFDEGNTTTATKPYDIGDLVFVNELLYEVIAPMIAGDSFVVDSNIRKTTIEELLKNININVDNLDVLIGDLDDLNTINKDSIVNAINEVYDLANVKYIFKTINDMKTSDYDFKNGDIIIVANSTIGAWEVINSVPEDLFNQQLLNGKTAHFIIPSVVNIHTLGVTAGEDISSVVQELIDNNVKHIYIPEGTYTFSNVTVNKAGVELYGSARGVTLLSCTSGNCITLDCRDSNLTNVKIHDLTINGNSSGYGIYARGANDVNICDENEFYNLRITSCSRGLYWNSRGIWNVFRNVWFYGCVRGMAIVLPNDCAFNHNSFYDCVWRGNTEKAFTMETSNVVKVNTIAFYHCNFESNYFTTDPGSIAAGTSTCTIINCHSIKFDDCYFEANNTESVVSVNNTEITIDTGVAYLTRNYFCRVVNNSSVIIENLYGHNASTHDLITADSDATKVCVFGTGKIGFVLHTNITKYF